MSITGFSYDTSTGNYLADYENNNKCSFKQLYTNRAGMYIKVGKNTRYLTGDELGRVKSLRSFVRSQEEVTQ